ncbi:MAG: right-handed parallel beta-helix repeat-containing protein [Cyclobacteriaceae bacterium]
MSIPIRSIYSLGICFLLTISMGCKKQTVWNVSTYGAIGDSLTVNTLAIQNAIDDCSNSGGGEVMLENGVYVSGTIILKNDVTLRVAANAKLLSSVNPNHFYSIDPFIDATGQYRGQCLIGAMDAKNIGITGGGVIDGRGEMFKIGAINKTMKLLGEDLIVPDMPEVDTAKQNYVNKKLKPSYRPFLIRLVRSEGVNINNINLRQPAAWTLHFYQCKDFKVDGVSIYSHANQNNDGIDIDSSSDGEILNSTVDTGDDAICFKTTSPIPTRNIKVNDCKLSSHWGAIKFGTESMGDFEDITISNCMIHDTKGGGIKILSVDGANISGITIDQIKMQNVEMPIFIRLGERRLVYRDAARQPVGSIDQVSISNIEASLRNQSESRLKAPTGIFITGTPNHAIGKVVLENIHIEIEGGGNQLLADTEVPENETRYPEFTFFGDYLPAYGLYARHIEFLESSQVTFSLSGKDSRPESIRP